MLAQPAAKQELSELEHHTGIHHEVVEVDSMILNLPSQAEESQNNQSREAQPFHFQAIMQP